MYSAKDYYKGNNHQPHSICGSCVVGLCQRLRQRRNPTISRPDVQIGIPYRAGHWHREPDDGCGLELCADVNVSAAARRSISVGGSGAPPVQKIGGGAAWAAKNIFFYDSRKNFVLSSTFS